MDKLHQALRRYFGYHAFKKARKRSSKACWRDGTRWRCFRQEAEIAVLSAPRAFVRRHRPDRLAAFVFNGRPGAAIEDARREESCRLEQRFDTQRKNDVLNRLHRLKYLYISPEALQSGQMLKKLQLLNVSLLSLMKPTASHNGA